MTPRAQLDGVRRGLDLLVRAERDYLASHPYRLIHQYDMRAAVYSVRVEVTNPLPPTVAELIGGVVQSAATLLDELAQSLAATSDVARPLRFPIHDSVQAFAQRARRAMALMPDEAQAAIEALQPYHRLGGPAGDPLWLLRELASPDARRLAAGAVTGGAPLGINTRRKVELSGDLAPRAGAFESGAVIASVQARVVGPDPKLDMFLQPAFALAFSQTGPTRGGAVVPTLAAIHDHIDGVVLPALEPFVRP